MKDELLTLQQQLLELEPVVAQRITDPQTLSDDQLAEAWYQLQTLLRGVNKAFETLVSHVQTQLAAFETEFTSRLQARGAVGTMTSAYRVRLIEEPFYPKITDYSEFEAYVLSSQQLNLLQKRLSITAISELREDLQQQHQMYLDRLEVEPAQQPLVAEQIYLELFGETDIIRDKISRLKQEGRLVEALKEDLTRMFSIPGVSFVPRTRLSITKR